MKKLVLIAATAACMTACNNKNSGSAAVFCDTGCVTDSFRFINETHPLQPYVYISVKDCFPDTVTWSYKGMGINRKLAFSDFTSAKIYLDEKYIRCEIPDTSNAWVLFNNCSNGRGYFLKIPFDKSKSISMRGSAINNFDPKFSVYDKLMAYTDRGNIFVEEMATGKTAMMTFGSMLDMDYDAMHEFIDSVHITPDRIWARVKIDDAWKTIEKNITLK